MKRNSDFAMIKSGFFMGFFGGRIGENMSEKSKVLGVDDKQVERVMMKRILSGTYAVSYTHRDVYKRQEQRSSIECLMRTWSTYELKFSPIFLRKIFPR